MKAVSKYFVFLRDAAITDILYVREISEKFLRTLLLMLIFLCYFLQNVRRDKAAEKEFDIAKQMTLDIF